MRSPEEAAKALNLNGIPYLGNMLKLVSGTSVRTVVQYQFIFVNMKLVGKTQKIEAIQIASNSIPYTLTLILQLPYKYDCIKTLASG